MSLLDADENEDFRGEISSKESLGEGGGGGGIEDGDGEEKLLLLLKLKLNPNRILTVEV